MGNSHTRLFNKLRVLNLLKYNARVAIRNGFIRKDKTALRSFMHRRANLAIRQTPKKELSFFVKTTKDWPKAKDETAKYLPERKISVELSSMKS